jgi:hypothetical protein
VGVAAAEGGEEEAVEIESAGAPVPDGELAGDGDGGGCCPEPCACP